MEPVQGPQLLQFRQIRRLIHLQNLLANPLTNHEEKSLTVSHTESNTEKHTEIAVYPGNLSSGSKNFISVTFG